MTQNMTQKKSPANSNRSQRGEKKGRRVNGISTRSSMLVYLRRIPPEGFEALPRV